MSKGLKHCCYTYHRHVAIRIFSGLLVKRSYGEAVLLCDPFTCPVVKIVCLSLRGPPLGFDFGARNVNPHLKTEKNFLIEINCCLFSFLAKLLLLPNLQQLRLKDLITLIDYQVRY